MANSFSSNSLNRRQDIITEALAFILSRKTSFEFKPLFGLVLANLRARNFRGISDALLSLDIYEKLQNLVRLHMVEKATMKNVNKYRGLASLASLLPPVPPKQQNHHE